MMVDRGGLTRITPQLCPLLFSVGYVTILSSSSPKRTVTKRGANQRSVPGPSLHSPRHMLSSSYDPKFEHPKISNDETWGFNSVKCSDFDPLGCHTEQPCTWLPKFRSSLLLPEFHSLQVGASMLFRKVGKQLKHNAVRAQKSRWSVQNVVPR